MSRCCVAVRNQRLNQQNNYQFGFGSFTAGTVKHLEGFQSLLTNKRESGLMTEEAHAILQLKLGACVFPIVILCRIELSREY